MVERTKRCSRCKEERSLPDGFAVSNRQKMSYDCWCRVCRAEAARRWRSHKLATDPGFLQEQRRKARGSYRSRVSDPTYRIEYNRRKREYIRLRRLTDPEFKEKDLAKTRTLARERYAKNHKWRAKLLEKGRNLTRQLKDRVFNAYGGYRCTCCGETERAFLVLDHVNNDGAKDRRGPDGHRLPPPYKKIIQAGFPAGYQVLCCNCNWGKYINRGTCPHQTSEGSTAILSRSTPEAIAGGSAGLRHCPWRMMTWPALHGDMQQYPI